MDTPSQETFAKLMGASHQDADIYYEPMLQAMGRYEIQSREQICAFCAQVCVESQGLSTFEEGLYYKDPVRLARIFPRVFTSARAAMGYVKNPRALSQALYNGYHGRGPIQLTWEKNYRHYGEMIGEDLIQNPDALLDPWIGSLASAAFWYDNGCNDVADDVREVTLRVNGKALMHLDRRSDQYVRNLRLL